MRSNPEPKEEGMVSFKVPFGMKFILDDALPQHMKNRFLSATSRKLTYGEGILLSVILANEQRRPDIYDELCIASNTR